MSSETPNKTPCWLPISKLAPPGVLFATLGWYASHASANLAIKSVISSSLSVRLGQDSRAQAGHVAPDRVDTEWIVLVVICLSILQFLAGAFLTKASTCCLGSSRGESDSSNGAAAPAVVRRCHDAAARLPPPARSNTVTAGMPSGTFVVSSATSVPSPATQPEATGVGVAGTTTTVLTVAHAVGSIATTVSFVYGSAAVVLMLKATQPAVTLVLSWMVLGDAPTRRGALAVFLVVLGVAVGVSVDSSCNAQAVAAAGVSMVALAVRNVWAKRLSLNARAAPSPSHCDGRTTHAERPTRSAAAGPQFDGNPPVSTTSVHHRHVAFSGSLAQGGSELDLEADEPSMLPQSGSRTVAHPGSTLNSRSLPGRVKRSNSKSGTSGLLEFQTASRGSAAIASFILLLYFAASSVPIQEDSSSVRPGQASTLMKVWDSLLFPSAGAGPKSTTSADAKHLAILFLAVMGHVAYNALSFVVLSALDPVTHGILNSGKRVLSIAVAFLVVGSTSEGASGVAFQALGACLALVGIALRCAEKAGVLRRLSGTAQRGHGTNSTGNTGITSGASSANSASTTRLRGPDESSCVQFFKPAGCHAMGTPSRLNRWWSSLQKSHRLLVVAIVTTMLAFVATPVWVRLHGSQAQFGTAGAARGPDRMPARNPIVQTIPATGDGADTQHTTPRGNPIFSRTGGSWLPDRYTPPASDQDKLPSGVTIPLPPARRPATALSLGPSDPVNAWVWNDLGSSIPENMGDCFALYLIPMIAARRVKNQFNPHGRGNALKQDPDETTLCVIGSITHPDRCDIVWGTGSFGSEKFRRQKRTREQFEVHAVRGPRTESEVRNKFILASELEEGPYPYGDPALFAALFFPMPENPARKRINICIIPNFADMKHPAVQLAIIDAQTTQINGSLPDGTRVAVLRQNTCDWGGYLDALSACDMVASSTLHGLIFSASYGIPGVHLRLTAESFEPPFKFEDFYGGIGHPELYTPYSPPHASAESHTPRPASGSISASGASSSPPQARLPYKDIIGLAKPIPRLNLTELWESCPIVAEHHGTSRREHLRFVRSWFDSKVYDPAPYKQVELDPRYS